MIKREQPWYRPMLFASAVVHHGVPSWRTQGPQGINMRKPLGFKTPYFMINEDKLIANLENQATERDFRCKTGIGTEVFLGMGCVLASSSDAWMARQALAHTSETWLKTFGGEKRMRLVWVSEGDVGKLADICDKDDLQFTKPIRRTVMLLKEKRRWSTSKSGRELRNKTPNPARRILAFGRGWPHIKRNLWWD